MATAFPCPHCGTLHALDPGGLPPGARCTACGRPLDEAAIAPGTPLPAARRAPDPYADDRWDQPEAVPVEAPRLPGQARAAGIIWIVFGGIILLNAAVSLLVALALAPPEERAPAMGGAVCGMLFAGLIGGVFIHVGIQTVSATAKDTLGNGIGSILIGVFLGLCALGIMVAAELTGWRRRGGDLRTQDVIIAVVNLLAACGLVVAGVLALVGRDGYRAYRAYRRGPPRPRRRR
jgi:hypothetical protein